MFAATALEGPSYRAPRHPAEALTNKRGVHSAESYSREHLYNGIPAPHLMAIADVLPDLDLARLLFFNILSPKALRQESPAGSEDR